MQTNYNQLHDSDRERFIANHWVHTECTGGTHLVTRTGIVRIDVKGTTGNWLRERIYFAPVFPYGIMPDGKWFLVEHWAPLVTINGFGA